MVVHYDGEHQRGDVLKRLLTARAMRRPKRGDPDATAVAFTKGVLKALDRIGVLPGDDFDVIARNGHHGGRHGDVMQLDLSGGGQARNVDPPTVVDASQINQEQRRKLVLQALHEAPSTCREIGARIGVAERDYISPRVGELQDIGMRYTRQKDGSRWIRYWQIDGGLCGPLARKTGVRRGREGEYELTDAGHTFVREPDRCGLSERQRADNWTTDLQLD